MGRLRFLTAGESHGQALVGILEGLPAGIRVTPEQLAREMKRRKQGVGRGPRQKIEDDSVEVLSGLRGGLTLGSPVGLLIRNRDWVNWSQEMDPFIRPLGKRVVSHAREGHADAVGGLKYAHRDLRNVLERASARETAMRVALGTFARVFLQSLGIEITSRVVSVGSARGKNAQARAVLKASKQGDTLGGVFEVQVTGLPPGFGSYAQWDRRLEGQLAQALMSLNAIIGVELGEGFAGAAMRGSQYSARSRSGVVGGMSSGEPILLRCAMKPLSTLPLRKKGAHLERSDVSAVESASVIAESIVALVLADAVLDRVGGDHLSEIQSRMRRLPQRLRK